MLSSSPLTASIDIQKASVALSQSTVSSKPVNKKTLGEFADDILTISSLGQEKQHKENQINNQETDIASDIVRVSSSIGRAQSLGNLTNNQAIKLYNKIAALL